MNKIGLIARMILFYKKPFSVINKVFSKKNIFSLVQSKKGNYFLVRDNSRDINTINEIFLFKIYNKYIRNNSSTIIDIGANIGAFSILIASTMKECKVYAYEPSNETFNILNSNVFLNKLHKKVKIEKKAIASKSGKRKFNVYPGNFEASSLYKMANLPSYIEDVECISINDVFRQNKIQHCDLIKIDYEGAEYEIIKSMNKKILGKVDSILIEYHLGDTDSIKTKLLNSGFNVEVMPATSKSGIIFAKK